MMVMGFRLRERIKSEIMLIRPPTSEPDPFSIKKIVDVEKVSCRNYGSYV
jgi:hypothetical protein